MKNTIFVLLMVFLGISAYSQKKELIEDKDLIIEQAGKELDLSMTAPEGALYLFAQKYNLKGEYTYDISFREKGVIYSVFAVGNEGGTINSQNSLKDFLLTQKFNFKTPKGKTYKFRHVFKFE